MRMIRTLGLPIVVASTLGLAAPANAQSVFMGEIPVSTPPRLFEVEASTGAVLNEMPLSAGTFVHGFSVHPGTGVLYALIRDVTVPPMVGLPNRDLCTVDTATGVVTPVSLPVADLPNAIAFDSSGTLWATTGYTSETLWTIDIPTGVMTSVMALNQNGNNGTTLAFNPDDGLLYHGSGGPNSFSGLSSALQFESIDPVTLVSTPITLANPSGEEWLGMAYMGNDTFLVTDVARRMVTVTTSGTITPIAQHSFYARGVAFPLSGDIGTIYCSPAIANSTGLPGVISASGSVASGLNDLTLTADQLPVNFGYFLNSMTQGLINPGGSNGFLCLGGAIGRHNQPGLVGQGPTFSITLDLNAIPTPTAFVAVLPGETWNFQAWYRDAGGTNNFTDAVSVLFQ